MTNDLSILRRGHRHPPDIGQGRVARSVVVDGDRHAELAEALQAVQAAGRIRDQGALGDLELERVRRESVARQQSRDVVRQLCIQEVSHRKVHGDGQGMPLGTPACAGRQGLVEHMEGQWSQQAGVLGDRDELVGPDLAAHRMPPADQRLGPDDPPVLQIDLRLEHDAELAFLDGVPQLAHERQAGGTVRVLLGRIHRAAPVAALRVVHRHVSALHEGVDVAPVNGEERDADARGDLEWKVLDSERRGEGAGQAPGERQVRRRRP